MRIAYVMDPFSTVNVDKDTTFALMLEAQERGHENYFLEPKDLYTRAGQAYGRMWRATVRREQGRHAELGAEERISLADCDAVLMRKDPPFDIDYVFATYLLDYAGPKTYVMNNPAGIRNANEKMAILRFPGLIAPTFVSKDMKLLKEFLAEMGGQMIIKPLDGNGGAGIFLARQDDRNLNSLLEMMTNNGRDHIMAQRYIPEVRTGDKRIMILAGEPLGAIVRVPPENDHRGNMHAGGVAIQGGLDDRDREILAALKPYFLANGLDFVGIDVIGGYLTEINVTSPTGIQEIGRFDGSNPAGRTLDFIAAKVRTLRGA